MKGGTPNNGSTRRGSRSRGKDPSTMGLPANVVEAVRDAAALDPASTEGQFFAAMYESVYGTGAADRNLVLGN